MDEIKSKRRVSRKSETERERAKNGRNKWQIHNPLQLSKREKYFAYTRIRICVACEIQNEGLIVA